jgi:hypothetical protein
MEVIEDTLALGPYVTCFQDILLHGQDIRSIKRAIGAVNSDYHIFTDIGAHTQDDIRRTNYAGWSSSGMASLTMLHKGIFHSHQCTKYDWRTGKDRRSQLGKGRVLWIKATTITGKKVNIINVYQATSKNHEQQERLYDTLASAIGLTTDPCILLGDMNASIPGGRTNYAPPDDDNPTTIADRTFANFVETTQGRIFPPNQASWKKPFGGRTGKTAKLDFAVVYNLDEEISEGYTDWISPLHDHARVSFAIGDSIWGTIPAPRPAPPPKEDKTKTRLKMEDIVPHLTAVNEICSPLAEQILADHQTGAITSGEGVTLLLNTRMTTLLQHQPARVTQGAKVKLQAHRNEEQRETKAHIVTLQKALDKPLHNKCLSLAAEASFTIMDLRDELMLSREIMQTVVRNRSSPWKRAVETLLTRKKQLLEDTTKKQILTNRWKLEERERQAFEKALGWSKFSKEDTTRVELGEIRQRTVTGLTLKELLPQGAYPHPGIIQSEQDPHLQVTHSLSTVQTLWIQTDRLLPDKSHKTHAGQIGVRGLPWKQGFLWVADGPDSVADLEQWAQVCLQQHGQTGAPNEHIIQQTTMQTIAINTTNLPGIRDLLHESTTWPNGQTISRELTYTEGPRTRV